MSSLGLVWNPEQEQALKSLERWTKGLPQLLCLTGAAGTGKTTLLNEVKAMVPASVMWTAMTGKAALRLSEVAGVQATTLHSALYSGPDENKWGDIEFNKVAKPRGNYLVVDESSMMGPKVFGDLQEWVQRGVRILFVGDGYQLPPVLSPKEEEEHGKDFSIFKIVPCVTLNQVMRSDDDIIRVATLIKEKGQFPRESSGAVRFKRVDGPGDEATSDYLEDRNDHVLITWRNAFRMQANKEIRNRLGYKNKLPEEGEPVLMRKNGQGCLNGEIHFAGFFSPGPKMAEVETMRFATPEFGKPVLVNVNGKASFMDGFMQDVKDWKAYNKVRRALRFPDPIPITYGYVLTAHSAQGSEFRRVTVFLSLSDMRNPLFNAETRLPDGSSALFSRRFLYTAMTRAKHEVTLIVGD